MSRHAGLSRLVIGLASALAWVSGCPWAVAADVAMPRDDFERAIDAEVGRMKLIKRHFVEEMGHIRTNFVGFGHDDIIKNESLDQFRNDIAKSFVVTKEHFDSHMAAHLFNNSADPFDIFDLSRDLGIKWLSDKPTVALVQRTSGKTTADSSWTVTMPESLGETYEFTPNGELYGSGTTYPSLDKNWYFTSTIQADAQGNKQVTMSPYSNTMDGPSYNRWEDYRIADYLGGRVGKLSWFFPADRKQAPQLTDLWFALPPLGKDLASHQRFPEHAPPSVELKLESPTGLTGANDVLVSGLVNMREEVMVEQKGRFGKTKTIMQLQNMPNSFEARSSSLLSELVNHVPDLKNFSVLDLYHATGAGYATARGKRDENMRRRHSKH